MKSKNTRILLCAIFVLVCSPAVFFSLQRTFAVRVACIGDSITYGAKIQDKSVNSYPARLQKLLGNGYLVKNFGANGHTLQKSGNLPYWNHANFQKSTQFQPDIVLIMLGTNDTKTYNWSGTENFLYDLQALMDHYASLKSHPKIYLMTPATIFPESFKPEHNYKMQADIADIAAEAIRDFGKSQNIPVIDVHEATKYHPEYFVLDGVHPDAAGADAIANLVYETIKK